MKPIAIFRHAASEGPGYFALFLEQHAIPWQLISIDQGVVVPTDASAFSGLVLMGGPMSVNDDLPWISPLLSLIRDAVACDLPLLGHCLGGQLISKALGAQVSKNPVKEIGWGRVQIAQNKIARTWLGELQSCDAFHWHGETFALPKDAVPLLSSQHCQNQAYALGKHLALQCHVEMTVEMIAEWCAIGADEIAAAHPSPAVQSAAIMQAQIPAKLPPLHELAKQLYGHWIKGLVRSDYSAKISK